MNKTISKLVLGSANFGLEYGLTNTSGKISESELKNILCLAEGAGVEVVDTAQAYGDSESRIGALCSDYRFKIVTKINPDLDNGFVKNSVTNSVNQSCRRLNQSRLYAVMLHRPEALLGDYGNIIVNELLTLKEQDKVNKIGISIYTPEILGELSKKIQLDIVQAPFNIFDQQLLLSGWSDKLKENGVEIHTRSVFLQGLLLIQEPSLPKYFTKNWPGLFRSWYSFLGKNNAGALGVALNFALKQGWIDKVVVGVDNVEQLRTLVEQETSSISLDFPQIECNDPNLINPSMWRLT